MIVETSDEALRFREEIVTRCRQAPQRPALDPEEACQQTIEDGLVVHRAHPLNGEISIPALIGGVVMPNAKFYIRNHFQIPKFDLSTWRLSVTGMVEHPMSLS